MGHRLLYSPRSTSIVHTQREGEREREKERERERERDRDRDRDREREREFLCMDLWQSALGLPPPPPPHPSCTHAYVNGTMKSLMMIDDKRERESLCPSAFMCVSMDGLIQFGRPYLISNQLAWVELF